MTIETFPRLLLTHVGTLIVGFIVATWCYRSTNKTLHSAHLKSGFSIILTSKRVANAPYLEKRLIADSAVWLRSGKTDDKNLCVIKIEGVRFHFDEFAAKITGDLKHLPKLTPFLIENKTLEILPHKNSDNSPLPLCTANPTITYGENL